MPTIQNKNNARPDPRKARVANAPGPLRRSSNSCTTISIAVILCGVSDRPIVRFVGTTTMDPKGSDTKNNHRRIGLREKSPVRANPQ